MTSNHSTQFSPVAAVEQQDQRFSSAFAILQQAISDRVFPGASTAVTVGGKLVAWKALGRFTYEVESPAVQVRTLYDLASVTKVVGTTAMGMILYERGELATMIQT